MKLKQNWNITMVNTKRLVNALKNTNLDSVLEENDAEN